ncbi:MAG TPA: DeoR/GlpR family DNA-binding transcription regulator [Tepidisphaeraceae bacterium]|jgi:DeoR/GlpR family transcriptional regulator of sugar metabolism
MMIAERQSRLKDLLAQRGMSDLDSLAATLGVSQSTVRRDLDSLEVEGLVKRTHGGVIWIADRTTSPRPYAFDQRMAYNVQAKRRIGRAARQLVSPGDTILIDGGTTTFYFAEQLVGMPLQIVTNSLPMADLFLNDENVELVLAGGLLYPRYGVLLGPMTEQWISTIHTKTLFFSVAGIHDAALYNQNLLLVQAEKRMMDQAQKIVLLADSEKFGQQALSRLCPLDQVDVVVVDADLSKEHHDMLESAGCEIIIATDNGNGSP